MTLIIIATNVINTILYYYKIDCYLFLLIYSLLCKNKNEYFQTQTYKLLIFLLFYSFIVISIGCKYYSL